MLSEDPYFSVLIPSYNRPDKIARTIESVLSGTFSDYEIIISDDFSPKRQEINKVIEPYLTKKNISFFQQQTNLREPSNKNFLVHKAKGKFNIFIGDDDYFFPNSLEVIKEYIDKNPNYEIYGFGYDLVDENTDLIMSRHCQSSMSIDSLDCIAAKEVFMAEILPLWFFHPATFCCKKNVELSLPYQKDVGMAEDMWFIFENLIMRNKIFIIPERIFCWVKIQENKTDLQINQSLIPLANLEARKKIYQKLLKLDLQQGYNQLYNFFKSKSFRNRFLYRSLLWDNLITEDSLRHYGEDDLLEEYKRLRSGTGLLLNRFSAYLNKFFRLIYLVGILEGCLIVIRSLTQRVKYSLNKFLHF